jgi:hypothetical protein
MPHPRLLGHSPALTESSKLVQAKKSTLPPDKMKPECQAHLISNGGIYRAARGEVQ